jgi:WD40 repeat protein
VNSVAFSPDGHHIVSCSHDKTIRVWDAKTGKSIMDPIQGHEDRVNSVAFSPDGHHIVSCSHDMTIRVWDAKTGKSIMDPIQGHEHYVNSVAFSPDDHHTVSCHHDKAIRMCNIHKDKGIMNTHQDQEFNSNISKINESLTGLLSNRFHAFIDHKNQIIWDHTATLNDGWLCLPSENDASRYMFWVPPESTLGLCWPGTTTVIGARLVRLDFGKFRHGPEWEQCRTSI